MIAIGTSFELRQQAFSTSIVLEPEGSPYMSSLPGGGFRVGNDPDSPERAAFEAEVEGRPLRVVVSGWPFDRVD